MSHESGEHHDHEGFHMPSPSWAPLVVAAGASLTAVGVVLRGLLLPGIVILAIGVGIWAFTSEH